jgi:hypothetical protein
MCEETTSLPLAALAFVDPGKPQLHPQPSDSLVVHIELLY